MKILDYLDNAHHYKEHITKLLINCQEISIITLENAIEPNRSFQRIYIPGGKKMSNKYLMRAEEVAEELGVSKAYAYKLMQRLNKELAEKGFLVVNGRVSRKYFEEQIYGMSAMNEAKGV